MSSLIIVNGQEIALVGSGGGERKRSGQPEKRENSRMIPFRLDYVIERTLQATNLASGRRERRMIKELTGVRLPDRKAREVWSSILEHKWYLGERLNRDVGLRTAAVDYLENIAPPPVVWRSRRDTLPPRLPMMRPLIARD